MAQNSETDPIENQSYGKIFFVVASIFATVALFAYFDEFIGRRSWKFYQQTFNQMETKKIEEQIDQAKKALTTEQEAKDKNTNPTDENQLSIRQIRLKIEEAELKLSSDEYKKLQKEIAEKKLRYEDAKQHYGFTKADQDEVYYEWKHALEENKAEEAEHFKEKYYKLEEKLAELGKIKKEADATVSEIQKKINAYDDEVKKWKKLEKKSYESIAKLEKKLEAVGERSLDIQQTVVEDLGKGGVVKWGTVDRCESCHVAINRDGFENEKNPYKTHPHRAEIFGKHPIEKFGCTTCHNGQGRATQIKHKPLEEGDFAHGFVHHWDTPLLRGDFVQASCNKCHQDQWKLDYAPVYMQGKKLFWDLGCTGCHNIKGFEDATKVAPSLLKVDTKVNPEWLVKWIKDPKHYLPNTKMPKPPLDIEEPNQVEKVAAYLLQSSEKHEYPFGSYPGGNAEEGKKTFETVGCYGCHTLGDKGGGLAPALDRIAYKTNADWIYNWIQDPKAFSPETKMPSLRLTSQEAANITAFLVSSSESQPEDKGKALPADETLRASLKDPENAKKGFLIISQYGCYGCHNIKGFEDFSKLSVDLTAFGKKENFELDFGDTKITRNWESWTEGKLRDPRMFLTEKTSSKMPNFGLSDEQIHALVVFLKGMRKDSVPDRYVMSNALPRQHDVEEGRRMVERLNCKGCHLIDGEGRLIEPFVGTDQLPPILTGIGARVRPDWLFNFLKDPSSTPVRTWIHVRMPTFKFSDAEDNMIIKYFSAASNVSENFSTIHTGKPTAESFEAGKKLAGPEYFSCFSCHIQNGKTPPSSPEQWGPDLAKAHERIRYEFIPEWVKDPQLISPGVKMPGFLPSDDAAPQDVLEGKRQKQAEAIRDYIMNLNQ